MTRERLGQVRQSIDHNPRMAEYYVDELSRGVAMLLGEVESARAELAKSREGRRSPIIESREVAGRDRVAVRVCLDRNAAFDGSDLFSVGLRIGRKRQQAFPLTEWTESREIARTEAVRLLRALADELLELRLEVTP